MPENSEIKRIALRVGNSTNVGQLAGAIKSNHDRFPDSTIVLRYVGAGAGNQAIKAVIITNNYLSREGKVCMIHPAYGTKTNNNEQITIIELNLKIGRI